MKMIPAIATVVRKSFNFTDRAPRSEFWWWALLTNIVISAAYVVDLQPHTSIIYILVSLLILLPTVAVEVRRFHDLDVSGWWVLLSFIPIIGALILLVWFCMQGTNGENQYGPDPVPTARVQRHTINPWHCHMRKAPQLRKTIAIAAALAGGILYAPLAQADNIDQFNQYLISHGITDTTAMNGVTYLQNGRNACAAGGNFEKYLLDQGMDRAGASDVAFAAHHYLCP